MALSMSGGAGGGGGMSMSAMAHQPVARIQVHKVPPGASTSAARGPAGILVGGPDGVDKRLSRLARSTRHLPLVCVDLAGGGHVAYHPPVEGDYVFHDGRGVSKAVKDVIGTDLLLAANDDKTYKSLRRYLTKGTDYAAAVLEQQVDTTCAVSVSAHVIVVPRPHSLLGARRSQELHPSLLSFYNVTHDKHSNAAIDNNASPNSVTLHDQALDGSPPKGDTYDRVCFHIPLHNDKKQLTMLPDEALELLLLRAKLNSSTDFINTYLPQPYRKSATKAFLTEMNYTIAPIAIAVPAYSSHDAALESWMELIHKTDIECASALLFPRSASIVAASLTPTYPSNTMDAQPTVSPLFKLTSEELQRLVKDAQKKHLDMEQGSHLDPLILTVGTTMDGYEINALQLSAPRFGNAASCTTVADYPFGEFRYHHARCARFPVFSSDQPDDNNNSNKRLEIISTELTLLMADLAITLPERKPYAILVYSDSNKMQTLLETTIVQTWKETNVSSSLLPRIIQCPSNACAAGTALLAAAACGRVDSPPITIAAVSTTAVGLRISYFGGDTNDTKMKKKDSGVATSDANKVDTAVASNNKNGEIKIVYDFDKRLPAGPYTFDFSATECAAERDNILTNKKINTIDSSLDLKKFEGKKGIPKRDEAALNFTIQVVQRQDRYSDWIAVDDITYPLCCEKKVKNSGNEDDQTETVACESARFEIRMRAEGVLVSSLSDNGVSIVQSDKSARTSLLQYYGTWIFFILFFGGFLVKSYMEDVIFQRDTKRVLAYYRRAIPNSMHDGDEHGAMYLVYKYRHKKAKLWSRLEKKYEYPIPDDWALFVKEVVEEEEKEKAEQQSKASTNQETKEQDDNVRDLDMDGNEHDRKMKKEEKKSSDKGSDTEAEL